MKFRFLAVLVIPVISVLLASLVPSVATAIAQPSYVTVPTSRLYTAQSTGTRRIGCAKIRNSFYAGKIWKKNRFSSSALEQAKIKRQVSRARRPAVRKRLQRRLTAVSARVSADNATCRASWLQTNCLPSLFSQTIVVSENEGKSAVLGPALKCAGIPLRYEVVQNPVRGTIQVEAQQAAFSGASFTGTQEIKFRACLVESGQCTNPQSLNIVSNCTPSLSSLDVSLRENQDRNIPLGPDTQCGGAPLEYEIVTPTNHGAISINGSSADYSGTFFVGTDVAVFRACIANSNLCSAPQNLSITSTGSDFVGRTNSLRPYKDTITRREAAYLVKKIALGGCRAIIEKGATEGLRAMVQEIIYGTGGGCTYDLVSQVDGRHTTDPNVFAYRHHNPAGIGIHQGYWDMQRLYRILVTNARYGSGLQEYMTWLMWHNHFATNVWTNGSVEPKLHYNLLWGNSLGYVGDFFRDLYGAQNNPATSLRRRAPGVDPTTAYDTDLYITNGLSPAGAPIKGAALFSYSGPTRIFGDRLYHMALSNDKNTRQRPNENLGRELLELHVLGAKDPLTNLKNYEEEDVVSSTYAITGYSGKVPQSPGSPGSQADIGASENGGAYRQWLTFDRALSSLQTTTINAWPVTFFNGRADQTTGVFTSNYEANVSSNERDYIPFLLARRQSARYFAAKLFAHVAHTSPSEETINQLATRLLKTHSSVNTATGAPESKSYDIKDFLKTVLTSEAMFSNQARGEGVFSPFEMFVGVQRMADLPVLHIASPDVMRNALGEAQQQLLAPPTVFGWHSYGVVRQGTFMNGEDWLRVGSLTGTYRGLFSVINQGFLQANEVFDPIVILPNGAQTTAAQAVDSVLTRFNLVGDDTDDVPLVGVEERKVMIDYLNDTDDSIGWNANNFLLRRKKIAGLLAIVTSHPANFRK